MRNYGTIQDQIYKILYFFRFPVAFIFRVTARPTTTSVSLLVARPVAHGSECRTRRKIQIVMIVVG